MKNHSWLILISLLWTYNCYTCEYIPKSINAINSNYSPERECEYLQEYDHLFTQINIKFKKNKIVNLNLLKSFPGASFDHGSIIEVPVTMYYSNEYGQNYYALRDQSLQATIHEFGHALFKDVLIKNNLYLDQYKKLTYLSDKTFRYYLSNISTNMIEKERKIISKQEQYRSFHRETTLYSEFYADFITAIFEKNKDAMINALYYDKMNDQSYEMILLRGFSSRSINPKFATEYHGTLYKVRQFLGSIWPSEKKEELKLLRSIEQICIEMIRNKMSLNNNSVEELNDYFIKKIKLKL